MFSNDILQFILFLNNLPTETFQKIVVSIQIFLIIVEIIYFFYIRHITKDC